ncbi:eukaryotic translation initiation factor 2D-like [Oncorhynchus clarkii lewisi]|uniref:eukaryotic translation initiation factor 2D-like n=1 Tax=Oncorhynchus clarkii lewisi TaxID=490388 RepID=UPI0039B830D1
MLVPPSGLPEVKKGDFCAVKVVSNRTLDKMQHCHQLVFPGQPPVVKKGHIEPIDISVAFRNSNKKLQACNLGHRLLSPCGSRGNCIKGALDV